MADFFVPAGATPTPITVPAGSQIAVFSQGAWRLLRSQTSVNYPAGIPSVIAEKAAGSDQVVSGVLDASNAVTVLIDAIGNQPVWYSIGTLPSVRSGGRQTSPVQAAANAINTSATATVAQLLGGIITSTTAAAVNVTLPTGTVLDAGSTFAVGDSFELTLVNTGANALAIVLASGITGISAAGLLTVATGTVGTFRFFKTAANTFQLCRL